MKRTAPLLLAILALIVGLQTTAAADDLLPPDARADGSSLRWNSVSGADGYNIYLLGNRPQEYLATVRSGTTFDTPQAGTYYVTSFQDATNTYSTKSNFVEIATDGNRGPGSDPEPVPDPDPQPVPDGFTLLWSDDFDGDSLSSDWTQPWSTSDYGDPTVRDGEYSTDRCIVSDDKLRLEANVVNGEASSCFLATNQSFGPGDGTIRVEFRVDVSQMKTQAAWFATWLRNISGGIENPDIGSEVDVLEYVPYRNEDGTYDTTNWFHPAVHSTSGHSADGSIDGYLSASDYGVDLRSPGFHNFVVEWNRTCQKFSIDGQTFWNNTQGISTAQSHSVFLTVEVDNPNTPGGRNVWYHPSGNFQDNRAANPSHADVDYVRVYEKASVDENLCSS